MSKRTLIARLPPAAVVALQYGAVLLFVGIALGVTTLVGRIGPGRTPLFLFFAAVVASGWVGGTGPGWFAAIISTITVKYFFFSPVYTLDVNLSDIPWLISFLICSFAGSALSSQRRRVELMLKQVRDELEEKVQQRTAQLVSTNDSLSAEIAERQRTGISLRESEERWRRVFDSSAVGMGLTGLNGRYIAANVAYQKMLGYTVEELRTLSPIDVTDEADRVLTERLMTELLDGQRIEYNIEKRFRRKDGTLIWASVNTSIVPATESMPAYFQGVTVDITERKRAEQALHESQAELARVSRSTTMGELVASIAHEVNQPLAAIVTNASACLRWLAKDQPNLDEARETARRIVSDGNRAAQVVGRIRTMLRKGESEVAELDINNAITDVLAIVHTELTRHRIFVQIELSAKLHRILGDRVQLQQVILNLIMNGAEAMAGITDRPKVLHVTSQNDKADEIAVVVSDSGAGLDPAVMEHIFDAFFTTKVGGMGMGLTICRSIVEAHGGRLTVTSGTPHGAVFRLSLPILERDAT